MGGLRQLHRAKPGGPGGNQKKVGRHGADRIIQVGAGATLAACVLVIATLLHMACSSGVVDGRQLGVLSYRLDLLLL